MRTTNPAARKPATVARFDDVARRAAAARDSNNLPEALTLYRKAVQLKPSWTEGWWYLGTLLYDTDQFRDAISPFERVVALDQKHGPAMGLLGLCEFRVHQYRDALLHIGRARELGFSGNAQLEHVTRYHFALLLTRFNQFEVGQDILRSFAREGNDDASIIEAFGLNVLRMPLLPDEAPADKRELIVDAGRAAWHAAAQKPAEAAREFKELATRYTDVPNVHYAYAAFLMTQNPETAVPELRKELEVSPKHVPARIALGFELLRENDLEHAMPLAEEALKIDPQSFAAHHLYGRLLLEMGDAAGAIKELETTIRLAPDSPQSHFALANAYAKAGRKTDAARERKEFQRLTSLRKD